MILDEIPGALERPGGCRIQVYESGDGRETTITIPPRPLPWVVLVGAGLLAANLLVVLVTGVMLFGWHRSVLVMSQISPNDLPLPMQRWSGWLVLGWLVLEALGLLMLAITLRPALAREMISVGPGGVARLTQVLGRRTAAHLRREDVQGFHLARDPQGLVSSTLSVQGLGGDLVVAENVSEADREWLQSVGNALLRRYRPRSAER